VATRKDAASKAVLFVRVGGAELGVGLEHIRSVALMPATQPLASGPEYLNEMINFRGQPVAVLDLARRLGREWERSLEERKLVVVGIRDLTIAVSVDEVREPELVARDAVVERAAFGGSEHDPLRQTLEAIVKRPQGPVAVLDPAALLSSQSIARLLTALERIAESGASAPS
jgi:chemotaxis signal transduction protein